MNMLSMGSGMGYQNFLGGGLGMGGFGMGSLFGTGFGGCNMFQSCDGSVNYDAMAGMAVGGVLTNCLLGFLGQTMANRQAKKANSPEANLESLKTKQANLTKDVETKTTAYNDANKAYETAQGKYEANQKIISDYSGSVKLTNETIIEKYEEWYKSTDANKGDAPYTKDQYDKAVADKKAYEEAVKNDASLKSKMDKAENDKNLAYNAKVKAEEALAEVNKAIEDINQVNKEKENQQILSKADGNLFNRTSESNFNEKYMTEGVSRGANGELTFKKNVTKKNPDGTTSTTQESFDVTSGDLAYALKMFQEVKPEAKTKWATLYQELYRASGDDVPSKTQIQAYEKIIKPWINEHPQTEA
ncbi:MAG: hypothetical protein NC334_03845 [Bacteroides sp.]|nr:hypothetical protein [Bacteroides sp.]